MKSKEDRIDAYEKYAENKKRYGQQDCAQYYNGGCQKCHQNGCPSCTPLSYSKWLENRRYYEEE